jgi:glycosyltransferase involved in cell wall biosynthesis
MRDERAVIVGCARNAAGTLPRVLANVGGIGSAFREAAYVIVENDSTDGTKEILYAWRDAGPARRLIELDGLAARHSARTLRLQVARNAYLAAIRDSEVAAFDRLVVVDLDDANVRALSPAAFERALDFLAADTRRAGVFANQDGTYYDMWALRHPERCPGDVWEEVFDHALSHGCSDEEAFAATFARRVFELPEDAPPLEVTSAFGGLGIYSMQRALACHRPYVGSKPKVLHGFRRAGTTRMQVCEHVSFHEGLRSSGGQLFVLPWLVNARTHGIQFPPSAFRSLVCWPA